jgi:outer membrane protein OmpA-like peptidoglycan-associated protein
MAICDFSAAAVQDSLPVFVVNAGPLVNSYYDDYSAIEMMHPTQSLYFTSRRPKDGEANMASHDVFRERILVSSDYSAGQASEARESGLTSRRHISVSGFDSNTNELLYYSGNKNRNSVIYRVVVTPNGSLRHQKLKGRINKGNSTEGVVSFAANGDAYFISNRSGGVGDADIWYAQKKPKGKGFYKPVNLRNLNTPLEEKCVYVTADGNTLYFSSNGLPGMGGFDVYRSDRLPDGTWSDPINMGYPINGPGDDLFYRPTSDANIALLSSQRSGGFGGLDVYYLINDTRIPFEFSGNVTDLRTNQTIAATIRLFDRELNMPVAAALNDTIAGQFIMNLEDIGDYYVQVESPGYRSVTEDFVNPSVRHSKIRADYILEKLLSPYTLEGKVTDVRTGRPVMAEIVIRAKGNDNTLTRTVSDLRTGGYSVTLEDKVDIDLIVRAMEYFDHDESLALTEVPGNRGMKDFVLQRSVITYSISGTVKDESGEAISDASVRLISSADGRQTRQETTNTDDAGAYEINTTAQGEYTMEAIAEGYFFAATTVALNEDDLSVVRNFVLTKMETGVRVTIENILFATGSANLRPESFPELDKLVALLRENPTVRIEVSGHTDNVGSAVNNRNLSRNRALSVRNYLISQGIAAERVEYNGYGFDRPIESNDTEAGRAANRRVEMEILE